jgi:hypothetical protein
VVAPFNTRRLRPLTALFCACALYLSGAGGFPCPETVFDFFSFQIDSAFLQACSRDLHAIEFRPDPRRFAGVLVVRYFERCGFRLSKRRVNIRNYFLAASVLKLIALKAIIVTVAVGWAERRRLGRLPVCLWGWRRNGRQILFEAFRLARWNVPSPCGLLGSDD